MVGFWPDQQVSFALEISHSQIAFSAQNTVKRHNSTASVVWQSVHIGTKLFWQHRCVPIGKTFDTQSSSYQPFQQMSVYTIGPRFQPHNLAMFRVCKPCSAHKIVFRVQSRGQHDKRFSLFSEEWYSVWGEYVSINNSTFHGHVTRYICNSNKTLILKLCRQWYRLEFSLHMTTFRLLLFSICGTFLKSWARIRDSEHKLREFGLSPRKFLCVEMESSWQLVRMRSDVLIDTFSPV